MARCPFEAEGCVAPTCQNKAKSAFQMMSYGSMPTRLATKTNGSNRFARGETCSRAVPLQALLRIGYFEPPECVLQTNSGNSRCRSSSYASFFLPSALARFLSRLLTGGHEFFRHLLGDARFLNECRVVRGSLHEAVLLRGFRWHYKPSTIKWQHPALPETAWVTLGPGPGGRAHYLPPGATDASVAPVTSFATRSWSRKRCPKE
jgi:hypothetical protein